MNNDGIPKTINVPKDPHMKDTYNKVKEIWQKTGDDKNNISFLKIIIKVNFLI